MNIPSKIKVGSCDYSVVHPYKFRDIGYCGICDYIALEIRLSDTNSDGDLVKDQAKLKTLMHEVIHAIDHASSLGVFCDEDGKPSIFPPYSQIMRRLPLTRWGVTLRPRRLRQSWIGCNEKNRTGSLCAIASVPFPVGTKKPQR